MALITVVMACHNAAATLVEACNSVINQTISDWELVIVNDASSDQFAEAANRLPSDRRIRVMELGDNVGAARARNLAVSVSDSKFLAIMDADDISRPTRLNRQIVEFGKYPDSAAVASQLAEFGPWGGPVVSRWPTSPKAIRARQDRMKMPIPHPSSMYTRRDFVRVGGYDELCRRAEDYALSLKLSGNSLRCLPTVEVMYRTQRPISVGYAIENGRYSDLARSRYLAALDGCDPRTMPSVPSKSVAIDLNSIKSWVVRTTRERII